jgi:hypothetical protein
MKPKQKIDTAKRKKVTVTPIERTDEGGSECYAILDKLVGSDRPDLATLKIAMAWKAGWTVDKDGLLKVGKCCKPNEVSRQLMEYDAIILISQELWPHLKPKQKEELVCHEMCHIVVVLNEEGRPKLDDRGRIVIRLRKHDIEEFSAVRRRYGKDNLRAVAAEIMEKIKEPLLADLEMKEDKDAA